MKKIDNIEQFDDLLKQQFDSFAPEPPAEVWQSLSQHSVIGNTSLASKFASAVKSMSIVSKAIIALAVVVATASSVWFLQEDKPKEALITPIIQSPKTEESPKISDVPETTEKVPATISNSNAQPKSMEQVPIASVEKKLDNNAENVGIDKSSSLVNQETKADLKPLVNVAPQVQNQVEKVIVKAPLGETVSVKEPETINQPIKTNTLSDVDTLIVPDIPNIFTPGDDDKLNKEFVIKIENESTYRLRVFDSKANLVFESFKKELHWNGQHFKTGENCESGNYFYIFDYQCKGAKELRQKSGYIVLTR